MNILEGTVISNKNKGIALIRVTRQTAHKRYGKLVKKRKQYKVSLDGATVILGEHVKIIETRPISKEIHFKIFKATQKKEK